MGDSLSPRRSATAREDLRDLTDRAAELKRRIRHDKEELKSVATMRRELIEQYEQLGIEVVLVDHVESWQGVERGSHGRTEEDDEALLEETGTSKETGTREETEDR